MARRAGFLPLLRKSFEIACVSLLLLAETKPARAAVWGFTRQFYPVGLNLLRDNWSDSRANPGCFSGQGRAFNVNIGNLTQNYSAVNLKAISVLVYIPPANRNYFDWNIFRLTLLPGSHESWEGKEITSDLAGSVGAVTNTGVFPKYRENVSDAFYTLEVLFTFPPVLLKKDQTYTAVLECRTNSQNNFYSLWESQRLGAVGDTGYFNGREIRPYGYKTSIQHTLYGDQALLFHPVILVYDLGQGPQNFYENGYFDLLSGEGFQSDFIKAFDFGADSLTVTDLRTITQKFGQDLSSLSLKYRALGGDGRVDIVAFGAGNLFVKDYLIKNRNAGNVRTLISVGAPNHGSWLVDVTGAVTETNEASPFSRKILRLFSPALKKLNVLTFGKVPPVPVSDQLSSRSAVIADQLDVSRFPTKSEVRYFNLSGNINVRTTQPLFHSFVKGLASLGDGAVTTESARFICDAADPVCGSVFSEEVSLTRSFEKSENSFRENFAVPDLSGLKFLHNKLLTAEEIKTKIKSILTSL